MTTKLFATNTQEVGIIPFTDSLEINRSGIIKTEDGDKLKPVKKKTGYYVNLPIKGHGSITVNLATLTSIVFKGYHLPWQWWTQIKLYFKDDDVYNIHPDNVAHQIYPEHFVYEYLGERYKVIPNFTGYGISVGGVVYNSKNDRLSYGSKDTDGYTVFELNCDITGKQATSGRHRFLALCYKEYPGEVDKLEVNHINHTPSDDWLDNLEWSTQSNNQMHSHYKGGLRESQNYKIVVYNLELNTINIYPSQQECSRQTGIVRNNLHRHLKKASLDVIQKKYRVLPLTPDTIYDNSHPIVSSPVTVKDYIFQGTINVMDSDGAIIWVGETFVDLISEFKLECSNPTSVIKKFKRGVSQIVPEHITYITLPNQLSYYGGDIFK